MKYLHHFMEQYTHHAAASLVLPQHYGLYLLFSSNHYISRKNMIVFKLNLPTTLLLETITLVSNFSGLKWRADLRKWRKMIASIPLVLCYSWIWGVRKWYEKLCIWVKHWNVFELQILIVKNVKKRVFQKIIVLAWYY